MAKKVSGAQELLKIVLDQIAGEPREGKPLIPTYILTGEGDNMCYDPNSRMFQKSAAFNNSVYNKRKL